MKPLRMLFLACFVYQQSYYFIYFDEVTLNCVSVLHPNTPCNEPMGCETEINKGCIKGIVRKLYGKGRG